ncbi:MAG: hypothetical protein AB2L07_01305 [Thermoanaerobaculaceae bacterium]
MTKPGFSQKLLCTAPDGTYRAFGGSKRVAAFPDRLEVGSTKIPYQYLLDLRVFGNVLHVVYSTSDGTAAEQYLRYDTFFPSKASRALVQLVEYVAAARRELGLPEAGEQPAGGLAGQAPTYAGRLEPAGGRFRVAVYSARASFPAMCPTCAAAAATVASLEVAKDFHSGLWFVPVCAEHPQARAAVQLQGWDERASRLVFTFSNSTYAEAFLALNAAPPEVRRSTDYHRTPLFSAIERGVRFVVYQYSIGAVVYSSIEPSDIKRIEPGRSRVGPGLQYSLFSAFLGWWAIPDGPILTVRALVTNFRGGIDVTDQIADVLEGLPVSASGL